MTSLPTPLPSPVVDGEEQARRRAWERAWAHRLMTDAEVSAHVAAKAKPQRARPWLYGVLAALYVVAALVGWYEYFWLREDSVLALLSFPCLAAAAALAHVAKHGWPPELFGDDSNHRERYALEPISSKALKTLRDAARSDPRYQRLMTNWMRDSEPGCLIRQRDLDLIRDVFTAEEAVIKARDAQKESAKRTRVMEQLRAEFGGGSDSASTIIPFDPNRIS